MSRIQTAERVSVEASDNFVFQRSLLAYHEAARRISGEVLEIGTGSGYGIEVIAPRAAHFTTIDKHRPDEALLRAGNGPLSAGAGRVPPHRAGSRRSRAGARFFALFNGDEQKTAGTAAKPIKRPFQ